MAAARRVDLADAVLVLFALVVTGPVAGVAASLGTPLSKLYRPS